MAAAAAPHPSPGEKVLDLCAAPGGKSTQLAAYLQGKGLLVCNEPVPGRAQILSRNIERMGVRNAVVTSALPEELSPRWPGFFDKILVDAPCSGEGMFRRHPETRLEWNAGSPEGCAQRQMQILRHAAKMLRPGGLLAYSTCTFNALENEGVIQAFLREHPEFSLHPFTLPGMPPSTGMHRLWPHLVRGEGHFVALMQKAEDALVESIPKYRESKSVLRPLTKPEIAYSQGFLGMYFDDPPVPNAFFAARIVMRPDFLPPLEGIKVLRLGLHLGLIKGKDIFAPDHALSLALPCRYGIDVDEKQARAYQNGQVLAVDERLNLWFTPRYQGLQLGWGKASQGQLKNHYPKGLRR